MKLLNSIMKLSILILQTWLTSIIQLVSVQQGFICVPKWPMEQKMVGHFLKWWAQAYQTYHSWCLGSILYLHTDTDTCMHICLLSSDYTVKPVLGGHSKKTTNYRLMQVKSIAECCKGSILQSFWPSLSYHLLLRSLSFLSGCLRHVLLYWISVLWNS